jgi:hypothetical protein
VIVPVVWLSLHENTPPVGYWDDGLIGSLLEHPKYVHDIGSDAIKPGEGSIVIVPGRSHADDVESINSVLEPLPWALVIIRGDEEGVFPVDKLEHPRMLVWVQTPHEGLDADRFLPLGFPPQAPELLREHSHVRRPLDWMFAGQVTHERREACVEAVRGLKNGKLVETAGFTQGLSHDEYYRLMAQAKVVPCPSGPETPDTFRLYEALEAGCVPLADARTPKDERPSGYWQFLFGEDPPFPIVEDWSDAPGLIENFVDRYPAANNRIFAWWQQKKRALTHQLEEDINRLSGTIPEPATLGDKITVLIPTSPIPAHPDTAIIEETIRSVRDQLPDSEIILMVDGVRKEQEHRRADYDEYTRRLLWQANHEWRNVLPLVFEEHHHQASMTREALKQVKTPLILFVEQDTPLCELIEWDGLAKTIMSGEANLIRLHHEALILPDHKHLMLDVAPQLLHGVPLIRTAQWSQRPHLASVAFYRDIIDRHFKPTARTMIEDVMHGVLYEAYKLRGRAGWNDFKVMIFAPAVDMKRSYHLDGRGADPKYPMVLE